MSNLVTLKDPQAIKLKGISIDVQVIDKSVKQIQLRDASGAVFVLRAPSGYSDSISILQPAPPEMEERWIVEGKLLGVQISEPFDTKYEADQRAAELNSAIRSDDTVSVVQRAVEIKEPAPARLAHDEIPF